MVLGLAGVNSVLNAAKIRRGAEWVAVRQRFAAARHYFRQELGKAVPSLQDRWFPYLVGLGLSQNVDKWFKAQAKASDRSHAFETKPAGISGSSSATLASSGWSGGGLSGGAGAGRSWVVAAGAIAVGVPSSRSTGGGSSSSGSSSSSSGGSSGGGGGGGW